MLANVLPVLIAVGGFASFVCTFGGACFLMGRVPVWWAERRS